eukprot:PITA_04467
MKGAFSWSDTVQQTFDRLKEVMSSCPVLALPDFMQPFVLECDVSGEGIDAVLMRGGHPIAFKSRKLLPHKRLYSIYDKEMLATMHALAKFRQYLVGNRFRVRTDHNNLKFFLEQKQLQGRQQKWISKIQAYDFDIEYVKGKNNVVADALSRRPATLSVMSLDTDWRARLLVEYSKDGFAFEVLDGQVADDRYRVVDEIIYYRDQIFLTEGSQLKKKILQASHDSPLAGHQGFTKTYRAIKERFSWKGLKENVLQHIRECDICQRNKGEMSHLAGLLQPFPIPEGKWECISMDFITGLPMVQGKDCIFVVVDRLTKYGHFFAISAHYTATQVAELFFKEVFRLHALPKTIVSDRDSHFMGGFWQELFWLVGMELTPSTNYHPQTDGQTEIVNKWLEGYLRNYVSGQQRAWLKWMHLGEYCYNTARHMSIAQNQQKLYANRGRVERQFEVGDMVYLRLQPYRQSSLKQKGAEKFKPCFYGPYRVIRKIGQVAYELELPQGNKIHNVFHVSCPKKALWQQMTVTDELPPMDDEGHLVLQLEAIIDTRER